MASGDVTTQTVFPKAFKCASFDGVDDNVSLDPILFGKNPFSLSAWVYLSGENGSDNYSIIDLDLNFGDNKGFYWMIRDTNDSDAYKQTLYNGNTAGTQSSTALTLNKWYHVAVVQTLTTSKFYLDGSADGTSTNAIEEDSGTTFYLGTENNSNHHLKGYLRDVRVYNRQLTAEEVTKLYNNENVTDGLTHNWKLAEDYNDSVGSNNGTNSGTYLTSVDEVLSTALTNLRISSNDNWYIEEADGGGVVITHVEA